MEEKQHNNLFLVTVNERNLIEISRNIKFFSSEDEEASQACSSQLFSVQHLPIPLLPLIGRKQEVRALCALLREPEVRLLTLTGPGGVGKTRLAMQISTEVSAEFADGICFVSLAPLRDIDLVLSTIAQALGLNERQGHHSLAQMQTVIRDKHFLLLLDSFEQAVAAAPQLKRLLAVCPHLKILITSRTVLGLLEEHEFCVAPLLVPDLAHLPSCEDLSQVPSVSLFLQRVRATRPDFELTRDNAHAVAQICVRLDGLPLALELAAARMKLFSPQSLLARLDDRFSLLTGGTRDAPERQQTLRKAIEWSYHLLTPEEQRLFRRLSVFAGGCFLEAIEAISSATGKQDEPLLDTVTSLLNQSLLQREPQAGNEEHRFTMLETMREYALECLQKSDEEETIRQAHAEHYLALAKTIELKMLEGTLPHWVESEFENLCVAFGWFLSSRDAERALEMIGALWAFWLHNPTEEAHRWLRQAIECCQHSVTKVQTDTRAQAMYTAAMLECWRDNPAQADSLANESLQLFRATGNTFGTLKVLVAKAMVALSRGHYAVANAVAEEGIRVLSTTQYANPSFEAPLVLILAYSFYFQGNQLQAYTLGKKGLALSRQTNQPFIIMRAVHAQALFAEVQGNGAEVQAMREEGMAITRAAIRTGILSLTAVCLVDLGAIVALQKQYTWAAYLWGKAKTLYKTRNRLSDLKPREWLVTVLCRNLLYSQVVEAVYSQLGEQAFITAWNEGQAMTLEQLLAEPQLQTSPTTPSPPAEVSVTCSFGLTPREREILRLLAQGLSSAQIAEQLVISLTTVNSHIRTIYSKLGVSSRSAATRYAIEHHLV
ncbi:MAG: hypothetical protein JO202_06285 [Ktedonobacteraceae bacterium]|nr:hypothetical protein [Ktedonobacteraceae bacterium]